MGEEIDWDSLTFSLTPTDTMYLTETAIDEPWKPGDLMPYGDMKISPAAGVLNYGQGLFEGMKAYKDNYGKVWLFRPDENFNRINRSSHRLQIPEFPEEYFFEGLNELVKLDKDWVKPGYENSLYIRPFVFASE